MVWLNDCHSNITPPPGTFGGSRCTCKDCEEKRKAELDKDEEIMSEPWPQKKFKKFPFPNGLRTCYSVGELIEQLQRLPPDLPIEQRFERGCQPVVYGLNQPDVYPFLEFEEVNPEEI
jgi:hypothetical protein